MNYKQEEDVKMDEEAKQERTEEERERTRDQVRQWREDNREHYNNIQRKHNIKYLKQPYECIYCHKVIKLGSKYKHEQSKKCLEKQRLIEE